MNEKDAVKKAESSFITLAIFIFLGLCINAVMLALVATLPNMNRRGQIFYAGFAIILFILAVSLVVFTIYKVNLNASKRKETKQKPLEKIGRNP